MRKRRPVVWYPYAIACGLAITGLYARKVYNQWPSNMRVLPDKMILNDKDMMNLLFLDQIKHLTDIPYETLPNYLLTSLKQARDDRERIELIQKFAKEAKDILQEWID